MPPGSIAIPPWFSVSRDGDTAAVFIGDEIGIGASAGDLLNQLEGVSRVDLAINSHGGDSEAALQIMDSLKGRTPEATITGAWQSAAVTLGMCADRIRIEAGAEVMIHRPCLWVYGQAGDLRQSADRLDRIEARVRELLKVRIGQEAADNVLGPFDTHLNAIHAVSLGLADEVFSLPAMPEAVNPPAHNDAANAGPEDAEALFFLLRAFGPVTVQDRTRFAHALASWGFYNSRTA